jgi:hypothetical protein
MFARLDGDVEASTVDEIAAVESWAAANREKFRAA